MSRRQVRRLMHGHANNGAGVVSLRQWEPAAMGASRKKSSRFKRQLTRWALEGRTKRKVGNSQVSSLEN